MVRNGNLMKHTKYFLNSSVTLIVLGFILSYLLGKSPEVQKQVVEEQKPSLPDNAKVIEGSIKKNSSLYISMSADGIPQNLIYGITSSLHEVFDLKRSMPGDKYCLEFIPPDTVLKFEYSSNGLEKYMVYSREDSLVALKVYKELKRFYRGVRGKVEGSLWETLVRMGEDPVLIGKLSDIFAWEIDFLTEVREGDEFDFVVEGFEDEGNTVFYGDIIAARYVLSGEDHYAFLYQDPKGDMDYFDERGKSLRKTLLKSPLNYRRVTSRFSRSRLHPILKIRRPHYGVDYAAKSGTPVVSAGDGRVIFKGWQREYGNTVIIRHAHGYQTSYGHLRSFAKGIIKNGRVKQNQVIGYVGSTGLSTGPHLDYRVKKDGRYVDPLKMELPSASPVPANLMADFEGIRDELLLTLQSVTADKPYRIYVEKPLYESSPQLASADDKVESP